jgi:hypothetical protein
VNASAILHWFGIGKAPPRPVVTQKLPESVPWSSYDLACRSLANESMWRRKREDEIRRLNARIHLQRQEIRMLHEKLKQRQESESQL